MRMQAFGRLMPLEQARGRLWAAVPVVRGTEAVELGAAAGRIGARDERAPGPIPPFPRATWDGYAVRSRATDGATPGDPVRFTLVGDVFAEGRLDRALRASEAVAIATGGAMPHGADSVLIFEHARVREGTVETDGPVPRGEKVARPGSDIRRGQRLTQAGELLGPAAVAALAATGRSRVRVRRRPRVALVPNGNELRLPGERASTGSIFESNNLALGAVAEAAGAEVRRLPPVRDDEAAIEGVLREAARWADVVVATGGSSVGEHDYLPRIFPRLGRLLFHGIAVRPGKPTLAASRASRLFVGMPGHPTSCLLNAYWLLLPALRRSAGLPGTGWADRTVRLEDEVPGHHDGLARVLSLRVEGDRARLTFRDSSAITSLAGANAFAIVPAGQPLPPAGASLLAHCLLPPVVPFAASGEEPSQRSSRAAR